MKYNFYHRILLEIMSLHVTVERFGKLEHGKTILTNHGYQDF